MRHVVAMIWWLMMQAVSGPALPAPPPVRPKPLVPACISSADPGDITVCARTDEPYRLKKLPVGFEKEKTLPKAEIGIPGGKLAVETEQADIGGTPSRRAMVRFKVPF
ncbi:hypothetical protein GGQ80_002024 [Sphingomonas jinjuensis]|uniref:Uncharacterized protein n=1 Tax=Sphingomonas jinjuensis TaxID=535907 RepID=A0A840FEG0_9SPHN|nr:hypothetical protein [Sphingomonas jinjuensis]MBB4154114.1 hypothetical protein [Sphingomonas jinjuensis]